MYVVAGRHGSLKVSSTSRIKSKSGACATEAVLVPRQTGAGTDTAGTSSDSTRHTGRVKSTSSISLHKGVRPSTSTSTSISTSTTSTSITSTSTSSESPLKTARGESLVALVPESWETGCTSTEAADAAAIAAATGGAGSLILSGPEDLLALARLEDAIWLKYTNQISLFNYWRLTVLADTRAVLMEWDRARLWRLGEGFAPDVVGTEGSVNLFLENDRFADEHAKFLETQRKYEGLLSGSRTDRPFVVKKPQNTVYKSIADAFANVASVFETCAAGVVSWE